MRSLCAPSSLGALTDLLAATTHSFISFAAMERVLRESDDGVVVYVAPSKALVNQVAAEAFARFSKEVAGQSLWAIHTGDYKINNPQNCQILVTVSFSFVASMRKGEQS